MGRISGADKFIVNPLIVLREEFDDWSVLFDPDTGEAYGLDPTGTFIWKKINEKKSIEDIVNGIQEEFDDVPQNCREEVISFLEDLNQHGYITND